MTTPDQHPPRGILEGALPVRVTLVLNGDKRSGYCEPRELLSDFIRQQLGATGTHVGCEHGVCGACTVRIDGVAGRSCLTLAVQAEGRHITTVEGLAPDQTLGDLQSAFARHHALQCGFCTAGILMSAAAYLEHVPDPSEQQVREMLSGHLCRCTGYTPIVRQYSMLLHRGLLADTRERPRNLQHSHLMLDLGRTLLQSVERNPNAIALIDGPLQLTYLQWHERIEQLAAGLERLGAKHGDRMLVALQNRSEMASLHWACQFLGLVVVPVNWRCKPDELDYCVIDSGASILFFEEVTAEAVAASPAAQSIIRVALDGLSGATLTFEQLIEPDGRSYALEPRASAEDLSLILYTSGTTGKPKGVPRRHRHERAAALAHVAQNLYRYGERTLGVMRSTTPWGCARCSPWH